MERFGEKLKAFNNTAVPINFVPVHEQIHRHAQKDPDKTAVIAAGKKLSFREMDLLSNQLAQVLVSKGAGKDQMIGVLFDREVWAYVAENAILKAGAAFLPFIPEYPDARVEFCLEDGACPMLLTTEEQKKGRSLTQNSYQILTLEEAFGVSAMDEICPDKPMISSCVSIIRTVVIRASREASFFHSSSRSRTSQAPPMTP